MMLLDSPVSDWRDSNGVILDGRGLHFLTLLSAPFILGVGLFTVCSVLRGLPYID